jgi:nitroreductase
VAEIPAGVPLPHHVHREPPELVARARAMREDLERRRTVRHFSDRAVPREVIEEAIRAAATAPSGANRQPWHFVAIADPAVKARLRAGAEDEEREFYRTAPQEWLEALAPLGTDPSKPFLEVAPWVIAVFAERWGVDARGNRVTNYYVSESVGIAAGMLLATLHHAGLVTLTHTPSPMKFLNTLLGRPVREKAMMLVVTGYPADGARVPAIHRKPLDEVATFR